MSEEIATVATCASCGSVNVQRQRMAWESGTASFRATTLGLGRGILVAGSSGTGVSKLARRVAPPEPAPTGFMIGAAGIGLLVALGGWPLLGALLTVLFAGLALRFYRDNRDRYPARLARYEKSWICLACGRKSVKES